MLIHTVESKGLGLYVSRQLFGLGHDGEVCCLTVWGVDRCLLRRYRVQSGAIMTGYGWRKEELLNEEVTGLRDRIINMCRC